MSKVAIITGISRGFGLALAQEFVSTGWQVLGTGRSSEPASLPDGVQYHRFDASNATESEKFWVQVKHEHAASHVCLINNAGGYVSGSLTETSPSDYEQQMRSCYFSAVYMTKGLALHFSTGRIINVISSSALHAHKDNSAYGAAKAAEMHFFQSIQKEFAPEQYRITNLYPSDIATHDGNPNAILPDDLAMFVREQAENNSTYYLRDAAVFPVKKQ
ncbi:MAG TPA: SDR family oxidoreductase [Candidatus Saccharimonadia bacterium]|jgi:NAD(P)-dependent dehydrogenase (short-subunit alcohol dehydrogenase family)